MNHAERRPLIAARACAGPARRGSLLARLFGRLIVWSERQRERHKLGELDERALRDIGLSRTDIERESRKPFWLP